jgi:hypothetical protein
MSLCQVDDEPRDQEPRQEELKRTTMIVLYFLSTFCDESRQQIDACDGCKMIKEKWLRCGLDANCTDGGPQEVAGQE